MADPFVTPLMEQALSCLCAKVALNPNPPAYCCFRVGMEVAHDAGQDEDLCCRGLAYVSLGDMWPSAASFPESDIIRQSNAICAPPAWGMVIKLGIIRCVPIGDGNHPVPCADWNAAALQNWFDAQTLRRVACCLRDFVMTDSRYVGMSTVIDRQTQGPVLGGCTERSFTIQIQIPNCECE